MSKNTTIIINLSFKKEELKYYSLHLQTLEKGLIFNSNKSIELNYKEENDYFFPDLIYASRTFFVSIENFSSYKNQMKIFLKTDRKEYPSPTLEVSPGNLNAYYDLKFLALDKIVDYKFPPEILETSKIFKYNRYMDHPLIKNSEENKKKLTARSNQELLNSINKPPEKIENLIFFLDNILKYLEKHHIRDFFRKINLRFVDISNIPLWIDNRLDVYTLMLTLKEDLMSNTGGDETKEEKLFFILNFFFIHKYYDDVVELIQYSYTSVINVVKKLIEFKTNFKMNNDDLEKLFSILKPNTPIIIITILFTLVKNDETLMNCLRVSWKHLNQNIILRLNNNKEKIKLSIIFKELIDKNLENSINIFELYEEKNRNNSINNPDNLLISNENIELNRMRSFRENQNELKISFFNIFSFDLEEIFKIFLNSFSDSYSLNILLDNAKKYKEEFLDQSIVNKIKGKLEWIFKERLINSRGCSEILKILSNILKDYSLSIINGIFSDLRNTRYANPIENIIDNMTNFSYDPITKTEQITIYSNLPIEKILSEYEITLIKRREQKLDFEFYFMIYNKQKLSDVLKSDKMIKLLKPVLDKFHETDINALSHYSNHISKFLNIISEICAQKEFRNVNFENLIEEFLTKQMEVLKLDDMVDLYLKKVVVNFDERVSKIFFDFFKSKLKEFKIEQYRNIFCNVKDLFDYTNKSIKIFEFIYLLIENCRKFLPEKEAFLKIGIDNKIKLTNLIFMFIKENIKLNYSLDDVTNCKYISKNIKIEKIENEDNQQLPEKDEEKYFDINNIPEQKPYYPLEFFLSEENSTFKNFYESISSTNKLFSDEDLVIQQYKNFLRMHPDELKEKIFLLSVLKGEDIPFSKFFEEKLKFVEDCEILKNDLIEFRVYYFRNLKERHPSIENIDNISENFLNSKLKDIKILLDDLKEILNIFEKKKKIVQKNFFKKIFEYNINLNKNEIHFDDILKNLDNSLEKSTQIKEFLMKENNLNSKMKDLIDVFIPLMDPNIVDNIIDLKNYFNINGYNEENLLMKVLEYYSQTLVLTRSVEQLINFIDSYKMKNSDFYENLIKIREDLKECQEIPISEYHNNFQKNNLEYILSNDELIRLVCLLNETVESYEFFYDKEEDDLRNLIEFVDDIGDSFIKPDTIKNCIKVLDFMKKLRQNVSNDENDDAKIIHFISELIREDKYKNICGYINDVSKNIHGIKQLYNKIANREEYSKIKIKEMFENSKFMIYQEKNKNNFDLITYKCNGVYGQQDRDTNFEEIRDLRDRSLLLSKKKVIDVIKRNEEDYEYAEKDDLFMNENSKFDENLYNGEEEDIIDREENEYLEICKKFSEIVNYIVIIFEDLKHLYENGFHRDYHINFIIKRGEMFIEFFNKKYSPEEAMGYFLEKSEELQKSYEKLFHSFPIMTFFHGRQIYTLFQMLINLQKEYYEDENRTIEEGFYLINYLFETEININYLMNVSDTQEKPVEEMDFYEVLEYVGIAIERLNIILNEHGEFLSLKKIKEVFPPGIFTVYLGREDFEKQIINIYYNFTKNLPNYKNILICDDSTSILHIKSFIYRAFFFQSKEPFLLINSDELSNNSQMEIVFLLNKINGEFFENKEKLKSQLVITYNQPGLEYVIKIKKLLGIKNLNFENISENVLENLFEMYSNEIKIVKSDASGVGKSYQIKKIANNNLSNYYYFPISGVIEKLELIQRLKNLDFKPNSLLHLDLNDCDNDYIVRGFLFELLISKCVLHNEFVFKLRNDVKIYIEIPFGFINYLSKYPILINFQSISISRNDKAKLDVPSDISSNVQIVANFLKNYENDNITQKNIYISCKCDLNKHMDTCNYHNSVKVVPLGADEIQNLIDKHFPLEENSFYQIETFINFLAHQFILFSSNFNFEVRLMLENLQFKNRAAYIEHRNTLIKCFLDITKYFTKGAYDNLLSIQTDTQKFMMDKKDGNENAIVKNLLNDKIVSFNKINFAMIFFNNDGQGISVIVKKNHEDYKKLHILYNICTWGPDLDLIDYEKLTNSQFLEQLQFVLNNQGLIKTNANGEIVERFNTNGYVFTSDNFLKMQLILLRINCSIPVIMMGETGCGKTSLIKMLAELLGIKLLTLNIHAGITDKDITYFIDYVILPTDKAKFNNESGKIWVFLDEINTSNSLGLISEILCKRTYLGKRLPDNICFICACNPYRLFTNIVTNEIGLQINSDLRNINQALAYKVNPLPFSLLNYVFDFGSLSKEDEKNYIKSMIEKHFNEEKIFIDKHLINFIEEMIFTSQEFIRNQNSEISSVSLRDVRRFIIFFQWFCISLKQRGQLEENSTYRDFIREDKFHLLVINSAYLSIFLIYYLRIPNKKTKWEFIMELFHVSDKYLKINDPMYLQNVLENEEKDILKRVDPPKGIAWNTALLENVFATFHGINNKIPVFICGKPGCSKSLAMQLIYSSLRGENSKDTYFRTLPRLFMNCYQGSTTSKSSGIINVFNKARNLIKGNIEANKQNVKAEKLISLVFFDEMGLAEISKNNPLKVLHSELEPDKEEDRVAFVGISNWKLDASKANRGIFIGRPDLDEDDLTQTAKTIAESYIDDENRGNNNIEAYKDVFQALGRAYYHYKKNIFEFNRGRDGFHGARDFYYLIKNIARNFINSNNLGFREAHMIVENSINRNFSGFQQSLYLFKEQFKNFYKAIDDWDFNENGVVQSIKSNLEDFDSRYLMVIGQNSVSLNLLQNIVHNANLDKHQRTSYMIGSQFENDVGCGQNSEEFDEEYSFKVLNKIQIYMEQGNILILSGLNSIYPSLYDLFNQNFSIVGGKKYARIALGTSNNPMAYVNNDFKCIILLNEEELEKQDPPFLNRFEKCIISYESLLKKKNYDFANKIFDKISGFLDFKKEIKLDILANLINFNKSEFYGLVYQLTEVEKVCTFEEIENRIFQKIIPTFSQDIMAIINFNLHKTKYQNDLETINLIYQENLKTNLEDLIAKKIIMYDNKNNFDEISCVYTYSSIFDDIEIQSNFIKSEVYAISSFRSEFDLEKSFSNFMKKDNNTFILKFLQEDIPLLNYSKFLCEQVYKNYDEKCCKIFIFIFYTNRILKGEKTTFNLCSNKNSISLISRCDHVFIDNINNYYTPENEDNLNKENSNEDKILKKNSKILNILEVLYLTFGEMLNKPFLFDIYKIFSYAIYNSYIKIGFDSKNFEEEENREYTSKICEMIIENEELKRTIIRKSVELMPTKNTWFEIIMTRDDLLCEKLDLISLIKGNLSKEFQICLTKIILSAEQRDVFEYLLLNKENLKLSKILIFMTIKSIENINTKKNIIIKDRLGGNIVKKTFGFRLPDSKRIIEITIKNLEKYFGKLIEKEEEFRISDELISEEGPQKFDEFCNDLNIIKTNIEDEINFGLRQIPSFSYYFDNENDKLIQKSIMENFVYDLLLYYKTEKLSIDKAKVQINENDKQDEIQKELIIPNIEIIQMLKFIIEAEYNTSQFTLESFAKCICYLINYNDHIQKYVDIFIIFRKYFKDYLKHLDRNIDQIKYPKNDEMKYTELVNSGNYKLVGCVIRFILEKIGSLEILQLQQFYDFLTEIKIIKDNLIMINYSLRLFNNSIKKLESIDEFKSFLIFEDTLLISDFFKEYINLLNKESKLLDEDNVEEVMKNFDEMYKLIVSTIYPIFTRRKFVDKNIQQTFNEFLINFLISKFRTIDIQELKTKIANKILKEENLLNNSKSFIQTYLYYTYNDNYEILPYLTDDCIGDPETFGDFAKFDDEFMTQIEEIVEKGKNEYLFQCIMLIFEIFITKFFYNLEKKSKIDFNKNLLEETAFSYFEKSYQIWENLNIQDNNEIKNPFLLKLYIISYMRLYIDKHLYIVYNFHHEYDFSKINGILSSDSRKSLVLKLYILKQLKEKYLKTWEKFNNFDFTKYHMHWKNLSPELIEKKDFNEHIKINTLFIGLQEVEFYKQIDLNLQILIDSDFKINEAEFFTKIVNENFHIFIDLFINKIFVRICDGKFSQDEPILLKFCEYAEKNLDKSNLRNKQKIAEAFKNAKRFDKIFPVEEESIEVYETYFILFKIYLILLNSPEGSLYHFENFNNEYNSQFIPGNFDKDIQRLYSSYTTIKSINEIQDENNAWCIGCYLCSCETSYTLEPCGSPPAPSVCGFCKEPTGSKPGISHSLLERPGHIRVIKNQKHRDTIIRTWPNTQDKDMAFKFTYDIENLINERINNNTSKFVQIPYDHIRDPSLTLPNLRPLGFRFLNILQNTFFYFNYINGFFNQENYNKINEERYVENGQEKNLECGENIQRSIKILQSLIEKYNIKNLPLFLNFIFDKFQIKFYGKNKILNCKEKVSYETELDNLIFYIISLDSAEDINYEEYRQKHKVVQEEFVPLIKDSLSTLLNDDKNYLIVNDASYPDFEFFKLKTTISRDLLTNKLEMIPKFEQEYPILNNFLKFENSLEILNNINKFNPFLNEMVNRFSYKISRKDAKLPHNSIEEKLNEFDEIEKKKLLDQFIIFQGAWKEIYSKHIFEPIQYGCRREMVIKKEIKIIDPIADVLNDDGEYLNGMYIAATYQYLAKIQNDFLSAIKNSISNNIRYFHLKNNLENKINIMKAKPFQIVTINKKKFCSLYETFEQLICMNACINQYNYLDIDFNLIEIEKVLSEVLIQSKKLFSDEQTFIKFTFESFRGENSDIITNYSKRVPQKPIEKEHKLAINDFIQRPKKGEKFVATLTSMIFFLQNTSLKPTCTLNHASETMVKFIEIDKQLKDFFLNNHDFTLDKLVDLYNYSEKYIFDHIRENVSLDYKQPLNEEKKEKINAFYKENPNTFLSKKNLAGATRRFISRFLIKEDDFKSDKELCGNLFAKEEFWENDVFNNDNFDEHHVNFYEIDVKISESLDLFDFLGGDKEVIVFDNVYNGRDGNIDINKLTDNIENINAGQKGTEKSKPVRKPGRAKQ